MIRRLVSLAAPLAAVALAAVALVATRAAAGDPPAAPAPVVRLGNAVCPVTGGAVKPGNSILWQGVEIGLGCDDCAAKFATHPEAYAPALLKEMAAKVAALEAKLAAAAPAAPALALPIELGNKNCPVMGRPVRPGLFVEHHGMKIGLCCPGCTFKLREDPAKYLAVLRQDPEISKKIDAAEAAFAASQPR